MIDRRFIALAIISFCVVSFSGLVWFKFFYQEEKITIQEHEHDDEHDGASYKEIDMVIPVQEFLKRGANSTNLTTVKRLFINQWIYFNQNDLIKLIMYAQGATSFEEMKKAFESGIEAEGATTSAASFIKGSLTAIAKNPSLIEHVNTSLQEGLSQKIHVLRGKIMDEEYNSREYKRLKIEYRKAMYAWINEKHGALLDELIVQL